MLMFSPETFETEWPICGSIVGAVKFLIASQKPDMSGQRLQWSDKMYAIGRVQTFHQVLSQNLQVMFRTALSGKKLTA